MHKKQIHEGKSRNETDTLKSAEMRERSLERFSESDTRIGNEPVVKKPEILKVKQCNIYMKKERMNWN